MPQNALYGTRLIRAWEYDDENLEEGTETWTDVQDWSREGKLKMECCGVRARATRSRKGLKYFDHKRDNPACPGGEESPEHEHLKAEAMRTARKLGFEAWEEHPRGPAVPDVYIRDHRTGKQIAVEIQLSRQNGGLTRKRTLARERMGMVDTIWFFKNKRDYEDVTLSRKHVLPFRLPSEDLLLQAEAVRAGVTDYLIGRIRFDDHSDLSEVSCNLVGYDFPCGSCGTLWYRTSFAALFPNRIRGDFSPWAIPIGRLPDPVATLSKSEQKIGKAMGRLVGSGLTAELVCPTCGAQPEQEFLDFFQVRKAPLEGLSGKHDMRWKPEEEGRESAWRYPVSTFEDTHFTKTQWDAIVAEGMNQILQKREEIAKQQRLAELERQRALEREQHAAETRRLMAEREAAIDRKAAARVAEIEQTLGEFWTLDFIKIWMGAGLPELQGMSMKEVIRGHFHAIPGTQLSSRSEADRLLERMLDPADLMKGVDIRIDVKDLKELKGMVRKAHRQRYPRSAIQRIIDLLFT